MQTPMNFLSRSAAVCAIAGSVCFTAVAGVHRGTLPPGKPPAERNAALVYWKAWTMFDEQALKANIDWNQIGDNLDPAKMPEEFTKTAQTISQWRDSIDGLMVASTMPVCDFELAYEHGFQLLLPHLSKFRAGARMLRVDARRLLMEHKPEEAAERVAAMLRSSRQLRTEGVLISSLVGMAVASNAIDEAEVMIESGRLTPAAARTIEVALDPLGEPDSLGVRACVAGEGEIMQSWLATRFTGPTAGKDFIEQWIDAYGVGSPTAPKDESYLAAKRQVSGMNGEALAGGVKRMLDAYKLVDAAWDTPDAPAAIDVISESVRRGEYGPLAVLVFPSFGKSRASVAKFDTRVAEVSQRLGEVK